MSVSVIGPKVLYQDSSFEFLCEVSGGNPEPDISWVVVSVDDTQVYRNILNMKI